MYVDKRKKEFVTAAKRVFNTEDGKTVLANLKVDYAHRSPVDNTPELTYYHIGKQDLVQELIRLVEGQVDFDNTVNTIINEESNYE